MTELSGLNTESLARDLEEKATKIDQLGNTVQASTVMTIVDIRDEVHSLISESEESAREFQGILDISAGLVKQQRSADRRAKAAARYHDAKATKQLKGLPPNLARKTMAYLQSDSKSNEGAGTSAMALLPALPGFASASLQSSVVLLHVHHWQLCLSRLL